MTGHTLSNFECVCWIFMAISFGAFVQQGANATAEDEPKPTISLEVELERGETVSRLVLFIRNTTDSPFSFETGSRGGGGSLDDGFRFKRDDKLGELGDLEKRWTIGTAPTVVPEFVFHFGEVGYIHVRAPSFGGPTKRAMRPHKVTIAPGSRMQYASFVVPTRSTSGKIC